MLGAVGEITKRAIVGPVFGKSAALNVREVGVSPDRVTIFSSENSPVFMSFAVKVT